MALRCNKPMRDVKENEKKLVNHKPEANNLHAFLGNSRSLSLAPLVKGGKHIPNTHKLMEVVVTIQLSHTHHCRFQRYRFTF